MNSTIQRWIESILNGYEHHVGRQARQDLGIVKAFGAQKDRRSRRRLPLSEGYELSGQDRAMIDFHASPPPPSNLMYVRFDKDYGKSGGQQTVTHRAANASCPHDEDLSLILDAHYFVYSFKYPSNCWR